MKNMMRRRSVVGLIVAGSLAGGAGVLAASPASASPQVASQESQNSKNLRFLANAQEMKDGGHSNIVVVPTFLENLHAYQWSGPGTHVKTQPNDVIAPDGHHYSIYRMTGHVMISWVGRGEPSGDTWAAAGNYHVDPSGTMIHFMEMDMDGGK